MGIPSACVNQAQEVNPPEERRARVGMPRNVNGILDIRLDFWVAEPEWPSGLQHRACGTDGSGFEPPNLHQCSQIHLQVCGSKRLSYHADLYTVSRCCTRGESEESVVCRQGSTQARESTLALKPRADVTRSPK